MKIKKAPSTALYPCPIILLTCQDDQGSTNIITLAWTGTVCSDPPMIGFSIRPSRFSFSLLQESVEVVVNIPTTSILKQTDFCGIVSGRDGADGEWRSRAAHPGLLRDAARGGGAERAAAARAQRARAALPAPSRRAHHGGHRGPQLRRSGAGHGLLPGDAEVAPVAGACRLQVEVSAVQSRRAAGLGWAT